MVSQPRKSTRITFTTLRPPPSGSARSTISSETDGAVRLPEAISAKANTIAPTPAATAMRTGRPMARAGPNSRGRRRSTSTNSTVDSVSTVTWVRARSGAPSMTNRPVMPYPTTLRNTTAASRRRTSAAPSAPPTMRAAIGRWAGVSSTSGQPAQADEVSRATPGATVAVRRITAP